jgi:hypothetical protein
MVSPDLFRIHCGMAELHPELSPALTPGQYREHEMLRLLADALPAAFRIYHGLHWSAMHDGTQRYGELDAVVVSPAGHVALVEIKSGDVQISSLGIYKRYGGAMKDVGSQAHAQLHGMIGRLRAEGLAEVRVNHFLLLPDLQVTQGTASYPRERIIDAAELDTLAQRLLAATAGPPITQPQQERLQDFLANRFRVASDAACRIGQLRSATRRLSAGLATWVPRIASPNGTYVIEATAGSGKTQLALQLLHDAAAAGQRALYVCFNRPLADHIVGLAPPRAEVATVHELAIRALRSSTGAEPVAWDAETFRAGVAALQAAADGVPAVLDVLVVDESQDFEPEWLNALLPRLRADGRLYVMGDAQQSLYQKETFDLPDATRIACQDNFRSPRRLVETINAFGLTDVAIEPRGVEAGEAPGFHVHAADDPGGLHCVAALVANLLGAGQRVEDIAVLSFRGREHSRLLALDALGGHAVRRFTGRFDAAGNPQWTDGMLLAESIYRFKGQSAPLVIVCEIDFETVDAAARRKLFVAMTRAQTGLHLVMSERAERAMAARLN